MERYLVFAGRRYYPMGGWDDFMGSVPTLEEAMPLALSRLGRGETDISWVIVKDLQDPDPFSLLCYEDEDHEHQAWISSPPVWVEKKVDIYR